MASSWTVLVRRWMGLSWVAPLGVVLACGGDPALEARAQAHQVSTGGTGSAAVELGGTTHSFPNVRCDLQDARGDGNLVFGLAEHSDGRRMRLEVERIKPGDILHERVTIYFGNVMDGDFWTAQGHQWPDGRWFADEGAVQIDGPLLVVSASGVTASGTFKHETTDSTQSGTLRADCGS